MTQVSYETISPIVLRTSVAGGRLTAVFRCPISGDTFEATVPLKGEGDSDASPFSGAPLRAAMSRFLRGVFRGESQEVEATETQEALTEDEREQAVLRAFNAVSNRFVWDASQEHWLSARVAVGVVPEFTRQLAEFPLETRFDRVILARMLVEIAAADGTLAAEEQAFLNGFLPPELGTLDELRGRPHLTALELRETTNGPERETLLMVAWAIALTDEELADEEALCLASFAKGLGLSDTLSLELRHYAEVFVIDQALDRVWLRGGFDTQAFGEVKLLATQFGLNDAAFATIDIRHRRRHGLS